MRRKQYANPEDMTDFAGLRVICYLLTDREIISGMLQDNFEVVKRESKSNGYNAIHLDASLKHDRIVLPEYEHLAGVKFEIQIVTILQHSWAEIEHDRRYKRDDILPPHIDQNFNSISETW